MTSLSQELYSAILAMDAYNRGYGANLIVEGADEEGIIKIGNATIDIESEDLGRVDSVRRDEIAGFYAAAYDVSNVSAFGDTDTVISYRGTDFEGGLTLDMTNGWTVGAGYASGSQAALAKEFYQLAVSPDSLYAGTPRSDVLLTGHSLGGGLAGFVGLLSGTAVTAFDHMPFLAAAYADLTEAARALNGGTLPANLAAVGLRELDLAKFQGYYLEGEALEAARAGISVPGVIDAVLTALIGSGTTSQFLSTFITAASMDTAGLESQLDNDQVDFDLAWLPLDALDRHSQALMVINMFGQQMHAGGAWGIAASQIMPHLFSEDIAASLGFVQGQNGAGTGAGQAGSQLAATIAYSALDEGNMIYGNTGIRSLFDDANDLGLAIQRSSAAPNTDPPEFDAQTVAYLGEIVANYAGVLAVEQLVAAEDPENPGEIDNDWALEGVLHWDHERGSLSVNLDPYSWVFGEDETQYAIANREALILHTFEISEVSDAALLAGLTWAQDVVGIEGDLLNAVGAMTFDFFGTLNEAVIAYGQYDAFTAIFTRTDISGGLVDSSNEGNTGNVMLIGRGDGEMLGGGNDYDMIFGLGGDDVLIGNAGSDWFEGGDGDDQIFGYTTDDAYAADDDEDTAWYGGSATGIAATIRPITAGPILVDGDQLYSIEKIVATHWADTFKFEGSISAALHIDAGFNAVGSDVIDFSGLSVPMLSYYADDSGAEIFGEEYVFIENFKGIVKGSSFGDTLSDHSGYFKQIDAGDGDDTVRVEGASSYVFGQGGNDHLIALGTGNSLLVGGSGSDVMRGGDGADLIVMNFGDEMASGGRGHDKFILQASPWATSQEVAGGAGNDYIEVRDNTSLFYEFGSAHTFFGFGPGHDVISLKDDSASIGGISIRGNSSDYSVVFRLESQQFYEYRNDLTEEAWVGTGDLLIYSSDTQSTLVVENYEMLFMVAAGFSFLGGISTSDLEGYDAAGLDFNDGFFYVSGDKPYGQPLQHESLMFDITTLPLGDVYGAEQDFLTARAYEPVMPFVF